MLLPTSANNNRNHNQICIASWTESYRGAECNRPIPESGAIATFYFLFFVFGRKCRNFLFSFIFRPKNEIAFRYFLFFSRKRKILLRSASSTVESSHKIPIYTQPGNQPTTTGWVSCSEERGMEKGEWFPPQPKLPKLVIFKNCNHTEIFR